MSEIWNLNGADKRNFSIEEPHKCESQIRNEDQRRKNSARRISTATAYLIWKNGRR